MDNKRRRQTANSNKSALRDFRRNKSKLPPRQACSEITIKKQNVFKSRKRRMRTATNTASSSVVCLSSDMSPIIDLTGSDSDDTYFQPRKQPKREFCSSPCNYNDLLHYQPEDTSIYSNHSLITIKPSKLIASASSEEFIAENSNISNETEDTSPSFFYNIPKNKESAIAYVQTINNTESTITLKRSYSFTSVSHLTAESMHEESENGCGDMKVDNGHLCDYDEHEQNVNDCLDQAENEEEVLVEDEILKKIQDDTKALALDDTELSVYDLDIDALMRIYAVDQNDNFDNEDAHMF